MVFFKNKLNYKKKLVIKITNNHCSVCFSILEARLIKGHDAEAGYRKSTPMRASVLGPLHAMRAIMYARRVVIVSTAADPRLCIIIIIIITLRAYRPEWDAPSILEGSITSQDLRPTRFIHLIPVKPLLLNKKLFINFRDIVIQLAIDVGCHRRCRRSIKLTTSRLLRKIKWQVSVTRQFRLPS